VSAEQLLLVGAIVLPVTLVAGASGFGFALLATPLLLLSGFSLPFVVTANLLIGTFSRVTVAVRLRRAVSRRRVGLLLAGGVPGLFLGAQALGSVSEFTLRVAAGTVVIATALLLLHGELRPPRWTPPGAPLLAGLLGGFLATTTSLSGVPPALLLARQRVAARNFFADMAAYFVGIGVAGVPVLAASGGLSASGALAAVVWLPGVFVANHVGTTIGLRLPDRAFRAITLSLALVAGVATVLTA
jgi:uncharacterized membrane protein YfcA